MNNVCKTLKTSDMNLLAKITCDKVISNLKEQGYIQDEVIGVDEVAQLLGVSKSYVFHHIDEIPHSKPYKRLRFFKSDIIKMLRR